MSLREQVGQLLFVPFHGAPPNSRSREYRQFVKLVRDLRIGGLILVNWTQGHVTQKAEPYATAAFLNRMQRLARIPLLVSADLERGASMRVSDTTIFPHAMAFGATGDPNFSRYEGQITAHEARAIGIHWVFYPVADVNNNPDNPIINIRSFGEDPKDVAAHVRAFIEGAHAERKDFVLTTVKHFPGQGATSIDTHLNLATVTADREHLEAVELPPFRAAIQAGVDAVMTAHVAVPALAPAGVPATLSPQILGGLLREQLGFRGLVVTDALEMGSIVKGYSAGEAAVRALAAGADVLLMTPDPEATARAIVAAIQSGRLDRKRVRQSVMRVLEAKAGLGLDRRRLADLEAITDAVNSPESNARAQEIADRAVTLVRNDAGLVPLRDPAKACFMLLTESRYSQEGQVFAQELRRRAPTAASITLDPTITGPALDEAARRAASSDLIVAIAFASVSAYRGNAGLAGEYPRLIDALISSGKPVILAALGSPYILRDFPKAAAHLAAFSTVPPSEASTIKVLFGEIASRGRLPVTIPGLAARGAGITVSSITEPARAPAVQ